MLRWTDVEGAWSSFWSISWSRLDAVSGGTGDRFTSAACYWMGRESQ